MNFSIWIDDTTIQSSRSCGAVGYSIRPESGSLDVRIPAATDLSRLKQVVTAPLNKCSALSVSVTGQTNKQTNNQTNKQTNKETNQSLTYWAAVSNIE